ncbi:MAG: sulfur carrier protein ThiS [Paramuribaculum sp.]|nr:sulfur carrier protein ThiS [Paramuribaculum sp.]
MITVTVNKKEHRIGEGTTVSGLLEVLGINPAATAVALNDIVIPKAEYATKVLADGDKILIIKAF